MPNIDRECVTHYNACDCREAMIKIIAEKCIKEHEETKKLLAGFRKADTCKCNICKIARDLL